MEVAMNTLAQFIDALKLSGSILENLVESIPPELCQQRRRPEFWTIAEHFDHLADVQSMLLERIERFQKEECPEFKPYFPAEDDIPKGPKEIDLKSSLARFKSQRDQQLELLKNTNKADWSKNGAHPEYRQYSLPILVRHVLMHDYWHMYRIEELWLTKDDYLTNLE